MKEENLDLLLERFDDLTDEISMCRNNLEKRKELLKKRRLIKQKIDSLIDEEIYSK